MNDHPSSSHKKTSLGVRHLTVLGEFKPFGLVAEALDGKPENVSHSYHYFLFDPQIAGQRDQSDDDNQPASTHQSDHELFIRGNRIIWTIGSRVYKRFTLPHSVIMVCWCRLGDMSEALLCVLQTDSLTLYNTSGEVESVPLYRTITSIWSLPFGLLLQQSTEGNSSAHVPFSSLSPFLSARDISHPRREIGYSPQHNFTSANSFDRIIKGNGALLSSHLILKDPVEEPQCTYIEERGKLNIMKEFDERTIWTSDHIPLMASYSKGKMQHSVWVVEVVNSNAEVVNSKLSDVAPAGVLQKQFSFRRIWQGKGAQTAASKVFLATDDDSAPIICFLLQEQRKLLSVGLRSVEINNEILFDIKPDMSWSIPAIGAAPVIVTRPRARMGALPFKDIIVLSSENTLLLYSGRQCLCRYLLPSCLAKGQLSDNLKPLEMPYVLHDMKIVGLADAVEGRINIIVNNGQIFRCTLRRSPSSSLVDDCIAAMAEGLSYRFYNHFLLLLWADGDSAYLSSADASVDSEWECFSNIIMKMCRESGFNTRCLSDFAQHSSWEFLIHSTFHKKYCKTNFITGISRTSLDLQESDSSRSYMTQSAEKSFYFELLVEILDSLHGIYESLKLDNLRKRDLRLLAILLCNVAEYLAEGSYLDHYIRDFPGFSKNFGMCQTSVSQKTPPSLFRWLESCLLHGCSSSNTSDLPPLIFKDGSSVVSWARKIVSFYSLLTGAEQSGKKLSSGVSCNIATGSSCTYEELTILAMVGERFGLPQLDLLPAGVSLPLRHALDKCRESPPSDWPAAAYILLGREDLSLSCLGHSNKSKELEPQTDVNLISMSTPYMLHLHPVTIPSSISDTIGSENTKFEDTDSVDGSTTDGMEHIFNSSTQLLYGRDLRLNEVRRLLCSARPVAVQTSVNPTASDQDLQQAQLWQLAQRTTSLPLGRGAFTLATTCTLLTEALPVPKLVLAGRLPAQQNATVNLDPNIRNIQELKSWPEFHNAVAAGLKLAPLQGKVSRTWIIYNKPEEPNVIHAGLLLALGLHGYLRVLTITDIYQYFAQEHESTTVGLMLGLAASYRGTMQPAISKALYVHIPARHPSSFPELELPTLLQTAALMSVGLLYEGSAHPQTMQILLAEIGRRSGGDNVLEREGYAVSAGFSLGLVALGRGEDAVGFMDTLVDRLFQYVGGKEFHNERSLLLALTDEHNRGAGQMMDGTPVNVDVTAPGAIIALALMFLKTESEVMQSRLSIPRTRFELQYVRPDFVMLRIIARNLIMWTRVHPSKDWIQSQIPIIVQNGLKGLDDEMSDIDEMDAEAFVQAYVNIVAGACISLGLRFAGTRNGNAQELLYDYAVYFLNEIKLVSVTSESTFPKGLSHHVDRGTLETCLHLIVLSLSVVMAGSGHLQTFRLLRFLRSRNSADGHANYGSQMAVSLAIGFLFLGGGMCTFSTSNSSIAALLITLYPRLPTGPNDNRCHLQAFRHLYVLATEARWMQTIDVDTGLPVYAPLEVTIKETEHYRETSFCEVTPCILPERAILKTVRVCGPRYWSQVIHLVPEEKPWWSPGDKNDPFNSGVLYIKRKVGACSYVDDPIGCQSLLSRAMHKVFGLASLRACTPSTNNCIGAGGLTVDQLVSTFSSDPSLIAFAQLCCDPSWNCRSDVDFQEFCLQVLFECVSKDRPALLQVYLSLYTMIGSMTDEVTSNSSILSDSLFISSLKLALAYNEALLNGRLTTSRGGIVQSTFLGSLRKRVEELLNDSQGLKSNVYNYMKSGRWPIGETQEGKLSTRLSWYLQWYSIPASSVIITAVGKIKPMPGHTSSVPLLRLLLPRTHINVIGEIDRLWFSSQVDV
ncbi:anaphase-promoting complex subunit 1 isoform X2 [Cornus florida]|uniref:anaphase-promoting complex subunit 1 isoform X2 n=1 Tax=Cornus florida TaxID=4283 RepID=UPI00289A2B83|nr:anaphase-promoting complex subunit 1 isoform X2 [Cornus florida]